MTMGPQVLQLKNGSAKSTNESSPHEAMSKPMSYTPLQDRRRNSFLASSALSNISTVSSEHDYTHSLSPTGNFLHKDQASGSSSSSKSDHDTENGSHRASSIISSNINSNEPTTPTPAFTSTVSRASAASSPSELRRRLSINTPSYILTGTERRKFRQRFPPTPLPHVLQTPSAYAGQFGPAVEKGDSGDLNIAAKQRRGTFESVYSAATTMDYFSDISTDVGDGEDRWPEVFANDEEEYEEDPMDYTEEVGRNKNEKKRMNHVYDLKRIVLRNKNKSSTISNYSPSVTQEHDREGDSHNHIHSPHTSLNNSNTAIDDQNSRSLRSLILTCIQWPIGIFLFHWGLGAILPLVFAAAAGLVLMLLAERFMSIDLSATRIISTIEIALIDGLIEDDVGMDESGDKWDAFSNEE